MRHVTITLALSVLCLGIWGTDASFAGDPASDLQETAAKHAKSLLKLAKKWQKKDVDLCEMALRDVLALDKENPDAHAMLKAIGRTAKIVVVFDGTSADAFRESQAFTFSDGTIKGAARDEKRLEYLVSKATFKGHYRVRCVARMTKEHRKSLSLLGLSALGAMEPDRLVVAGLFRRAPMFKQKHSTKGFTSFPSTPKTLRPSVVAEDWNLFELEVTKTEVVARIAGQQVARVARDDDLPEDGTIALAAQMCDIEIRSIEVWQYE